MHTHAHVLHMSWTNFVHSHHPAIHSHTLARTMRVTRGNCNNLLHFLLVSITPLYDWRCHTVNLCTLHLPIKAASSSRWQRSIYRRWLWYFERARAQSSAPCWFHVQRRMAVLMMTELSDSEFPRHLHCWRRPLQLLYQNAVLPLRGR